MNMQKALWPRRTVDRIGWREPAISSVKLTDREMNEIDELADPRAALKAIYLRHR